MWWCDLWHVVPPQRTGPETGIGIILLSTSKASLICSDQIKLSIVVHWTTQIGKETLITDRNRFDASAKSDSSPARVEGTAIVLAKRYNSSANWRIQLIPSSWKRPGPIQPKTRKLQKRSNTWDSPDNSKMNIEDYGGYFSHETNQIRHKNAWNHTGHSEIVLRIYHPSRKRKSIMTSVLLQRISSEEVNNCPV